MIFISKLFSEKFFLFRKKLGRKPEEMEIDGIHKKLMI